MKRKFSINSNQQRNIITGLIFQNRHYSKEKSNGTSDIKQVIKKVKKKAIDTKSSTTVTAGIFLY